MPPLTVDDLQERMKTYAAEYLQLAQQRAAKPVLLNGDGTRHGLNHMLELIQMFPDGNDGEFKVRE